MKREDLSSTALEKRILSDFDEGAIEKFLGKTLPILRAYLIRRFHLSAESAEDILQDVLLLFVNKRKEISRLGPWLVGAAVHKALNFVRKEASHRQRLEESSHEVQVERQFLEMAEAMERLPANERQVLQGLYVEGLTYRELRERTRLSRKTLAKRRNRALKTLREYFRGNTFTSPAHPSHRRVTSCSVQGERYETPWCEKATRA